MNDPLSILRADHREAKGLLEKLADTDEGAMRERLVAELEAALTLHMSIEEQLLYPLVAEHVGEDDEHEAEVEHGLARDGLAKLVAMVAEPGFGAAVEMLKAGIGHHVKEEESELLPELKAAVGREQWLALGDAIAQAKADAGAPLTRAAARTTKPSAGTRRSKSSAKRSAPARSAR